MTEPERAGGRRVSRRDFLFTAAVGTGAMIGAGVVVTPARASNKASQKAVQYQPTPKGGQRCSSCKNFQVPASCKLVDGAISASGWCMLYQARK